MSHASHTLVVHELHVTGQYCSAKALVSVRVQRFKVPIRGEKALVILAQLVTVPGSTATESRALLESAAAATVAAFESVHVLPLPVLSPHVFCNRVQHSEPESAQVEHGVELALVT